MKLRNKKTGEIYAMWHICIGGEEITSVKQFNNTFEDYIPKEPIIKDKKIRKAVRVWAEANNIRCVAYHKCSHYWYLRAFNDNEQAIDFWLSYNAEPEMKEDEFYTIAELCGEEE